MIQISETDFIRIKNNIDYIVSAVERQKELYKLLQKNDQSLYETTKNEHYKYSSESNICHIKICDLLISNGKEAQSVLRANIPTFASVQPA